MPRGVYERKKKVKSTVIVSDMPTQATLTEEYVATTAVEEAPNIGQGTIEVVHDPAVLGTINLNVFKGVECDLYYNNMLNCFQLGSILFEVIEDQNDGYRSALEEVRIVSQTAPMKPGDYLGKVVVESAGATPNYGNFSGHVIKDAVTGHIYYEIGTDDSDSYYPCFVFCYTKPNSPF